MAHRVDNEKEHGRGTWHGGHVHDGRVCFERHATSCCESYRRAHPDVDKIKGAACGYCGREYNATSTDKE